MGHVYIQISLGLIFFRPSCINLEETILGALHEKVQPVEIRQINKISPISTLIVLDV